MPATDATDVAQASQDAESNTEATAETTDTEATQATEAAEGDVATITAVAVGEGDEQRFVSGKAIIRKGDNLWTIAGAFMALV